MQSQGCYFLTLFSVLTPTVSRKFTGLRSRTMALGSVGSGSWSTSMVAMSLWSSAFGSSCWLEADVTQLVFSKKYWNIAHIKTHSNQKKKPQNFYTDLECYQSFLAHHVFSLLLEFFLQFLGHFLFMPLSFSFQFLLYWQELCDVNPRLKETAQNNIIIAWNVLLFNWAWVLLVKRNQSNWLYHTRINRHCRFVCIIKPLLTKGVSFKINLRIWINTNENLNQQLKIIPALKYIFILIMQEIEYTVWIINPLHIGGVWLFQSYSCPSLKFSEIII